ncbi:uncharacterized protein Z518_01673 [Rhinocladiella mackenziei CBS 650.93]|uniref:Vacuolar protein sorting 55 superfamily n=1 Tax=Rhinocladiella mackenziei CBS 650.93 TaxID=1442369 RepID=A0A0D2IX58_9EURO|nr:uncharacterized protein Z518_01673 [Rhinocladiella mackenziei CBS 650.93]KIX10589.1 hypothetical protein Z518_01673 [Rhinocladiella mackenziei CBS 650.93]
MTAGLKTIIALSFVLAIGFLLVILSAALFHNFLTLLVVATYVLAPVPNWVAGRCANPDDFIETNSSAWVDLGRFVTGFLVVMGIALPVLLAHCALIQVPAMVMSIIGGLLIYGTIISFTQFFKEEQDF